jgi:hypothetical protein
LITDIDKFNQLEQEERQEVVKQFDYQAFNMKMQKVISNQEMIVQMEKYQKIQQKQKRNRERVQRRTLREQQAREETESDVDSIEDDISSEEEVKVTTNKRGPYKRRKTSSATEREEPHLISRQ